MAPRVTLTTDQPQLWVSEPEDGHWIDVDPARISAEALNEALVGTGITVTSCEFNDTGAFTITPEMCQELSAFPGTTYADMPPFYDLRVRVAGDEHDDALVIQLPARWNGRYLAVGGAGNRTENGFGFDLANSRVFSVPRAVQNGFVGSLTDGGVGRPMATDWTLREDGTPDWELLRNFAYASTHRMAEATKAVIEAAYGQAPDFSYFVGASGGARQALVEAQRYPEDFDGVWGDCPVVNWTRLLPAELWPAVVMEQTGCVLPEEKLDAFADYVVEREGGEEAFAHRLERSEVRAAEAVGRSTTVGPLTEQDAATMQLIWDGPRDANGERLWWGLRPGVRSWAGPGLGLASSDDSQAQPFFLSEMFVRDWLMKDPSWDWHTLTLEGFADAFARGVEEYAEVASDAADLTGLAESGHKLIVSHGTFDPLVFPEGTLDWWHRAEEAVGSPVALGECARLFIFPATAHGTIDALPSFTMADGMAALMRWVEQGWAPDVVEGHLVDAETGQVTGAGPVAAQ